MVRQGHLIALVVAFMIGCAVLLVAGASGVQAEASQHNKQKLSGTNGRDNLRGGDGDEEIRGLGGSDDIFHGSGDDVIYAGPGNDDVFPDEGKDVIYGGDGNDMLASNDGDGQGDKLYCGKGKDTYLDDSTDYVDSSCETASAPPSSFSGHDNITSSASVTSSASASPVPVPSSGGPAILLPTAALLLGSGILAYAILRRR